MGKIRYICVILWCLMSIATYSAPLKASRSVPEIADSLYSVHDYRGALDAYTRWVKEVPSANNYYNLGNTYYQLHMYPQAILCYERALRMDAKHEDARANLELANKHIVAYSSLQETDEMIFVSLLNRLRGALSIDAWAFVMLGCLVVLLLGGGVVYLKRDPQVIKLAIGIGGASLAVMLMAFVMVHQLSGYRNDRSRVVMMRDADLVDAPSPSASHLSDLSGGMVLKLHGRHGEWVQVMVPSGVVGWVNDKDIETI